ncbi:unnamed protein product [Spirodela intermedia]|uniref:Uncharacterized protein n=1 Tax=Spirodela intermedia TaxID=51605 RepID=A0A7I8JNG4_SPIIN|nr:unnamed protein product [Spirodela intermedia]CAA6671698.1 unnamed protein product [Spirodela intermedia]
MPYATSSLSTEVENQSRQQQFALGLLAMCFMMAEFHQPAQAVRSLLFEVYSAFLYLTFMAAVVLSVNSLRPLEEEPGYKTFVLRSCLALPPPSLLRVWFLPMALAIALLLASYRWKCRSAAQDTVAGHPRHQEPNPSSSQLPDLGSSPCYSSGRRRGNAAPVWAQNLQMSCDSPCSPFFWASNNINFSLFVRLLCTRLTQGPTFFNLQRLLLRQGGGIA